MNKITATKHTFQSCLVSSKLAVRGLFRASPLLSFFRTGNGRTTSPSVLLDTKLCKLSLSVRFRLVARALIYGERVSFECEHEGEPGSRTGKFVTYWRESLCIRQ